MQVLRDEHRHFGEQRVDGDATLDVAGDTLELVAEFDPDDAERVGLILRCAPDGYEALTADENGILRSEQFPGLWLNTAAFWQGDLPQILATVQDGIATPEHEAFVTRLQAQTEE